MKAASSILGVALVAIAGAVLSGCVAHIPLAKAAPDLSYKSVRPTLVAVVDERQVLSQGKPPTYVGRAHGAFGIPMDMQAYPWVVTEKEKKDQTLAQALEDRIVVGLNDEGWALTSLALTSKPTQAESLALMADRKATRLIVMSISQWFVSINMSLVSAFNFDWGYQLDVLDDQGAILTTVKESGRDVVDAKGSESYPNLIKLAYRERLIKILEQPQVRAALEDRP